MHKNLPFTRVLIFLAFILSAVVGADAALGIDEQAGCLSSGWPSERSDLQPDPALVRGVLANGMRYVVMENHEPENRVALYLYIRAGSLHESPGQRGVAHFLEHMLFNGTTHFQPGELVQFFQDIGMSFGGDTNAHTSYEETVYNINLPDGSEDVLRKGFLVMSDYARGALLLEDEVERERGVILAEKRSRDSARYRAFVAANEFKYRGTLLPKRQVIGDESVLKSADRALLKDYYDGWYRPENMMLVVVGDVMEEQVVSLISEMFSPLSGAGDIPPCPDLGRLEHSGQEVFYHHEKELGKTEVAIESVWNTAPVDDSSRLEAEELRRYASILILMNRLQKLQEQKGEVLSEVGYYSGDMLQRFRYSTLMASTSADTWSETLGLLEYTLRQALEYGFHEEEFDRVKKDIQASLESAVLTSKSRESDMLGRAIIRDFGDNRVFQSPEQERELYSKILADMTAEDVNRVFRKDWSFGSRLISINGDAVIGGDQPQNTIAGVYNTYLSRKVYPFTLQSSGTFPYLMPQDVDRSVIEQSMKYEEVDADRLVFKNNIAVTLKQTDYEPNTVKVVVDVGQGKLSEPVPGLAMLAEEVVNDSGTGTLPRSALADILSGTTVKVSFAVGEESLRWTARAVSKESELLLQLLYTLVRDPGLREQAYARARNELEQRYDRMASDIQGTIRTKVDRFLANGDPRIGLPPWEQVEVLRLEQLQEWLLPQIRHGSMEIAIVGDFEPAQMKELVLKYFGALQKREPVTAHSSSLIFPAGQDLVAEVDSSVEKSMVIVAWPTAGFWDIHRTRRLHVLAEIFRERLRQVIREKLGASYAPVVYSAPSRVYGDYGKLQVQVIVAPGREQEILTEILKLAEQLRTDTISADELDRVKGPFMTSLKDSVKTNDYWLQSVLANSRRHPQQLHWPRSLLSDFAGITAQEIEKLANLYLVSEKKATAVIRPVKTP